MRRELMKANSQAAGSDYRAQVSVDLTVPRPPQLDLPSIGGPVTSVLAYHSSMGRPEVPNAARITMSCGSSGP